MDDKITEFLDQKGITDEFIRNIVHGFIKRHTKLYGDVISFESLMERLNENLDFINIVDPSKQKDKTGYLCQSVVGNYDGFNNTITMFFTQEDLKNPQLREAFISILIHELTHCAYTIKQNDINNSYKHIFGTYEKLINGDTPLIEGNMTYMEPIINYISTKIFGKKNGMYLAQTINIAKLTSVVGEKDIIKSAFDSDEEAFKQCFSSFEEGAYEYFTKGMEWLSSNGEYSYKKGTKIMNNFFSGSISALDDNPIKDLEPLPHKRH